MDLSVALNREYHALADAGAPLVQIEEPAIHQVIADPNQKIKPEKWVEAFNAEVKGLRDKCEVWCHTCWGSPAAQRVASKDQSYKAALPYFDQLDVDVHHRRGRLQQRHGPRAFRHDDRQGQEDRARRHQPPHACRSSGRRRSPTLIRRALKHIEPERLILTSDCGFGRQSMSRMHAIYKMIALVRGTNIVRKELGLPEAYIPGADAQLSMVPLSSCLARKIARF